MAERETAGGWDLIVAPWHLDEHIPAFPVPIGVAETIRPTLSDGPVPVRMTRLHSAVAAAVARAARPLVLSGDCPTAIGTTGTAARTEATTSRAWISLASSAANSDRKSVV